MATLLTTRKMSPALAARVQASVSGRRGTAGGATPAPVLKSLVRVGVVALVVVVVWSGVAARRRAQRELDRDRAALRDRARADSAMVTDADRAAVVRVESWLARLAGPWEGEARADELRGPGGAAAWTALLARRAIYVHGTSRALARPEAIDEAATASLKDAFLFCLLDPPASHTEKLLLAKVRIAYRGGARVEERTGNVRRLRDALAVLPFLAPAWLDRIERAKDVEEVAALRAEWEKAPIIAAKQAMAAEVLIAAIDEADTATGPTELDGERAHDVRVAIVELASGRVALRTRKRVDPSWISPNARAEYASGIDGCGLAMDVRETP